jgi:hypothetical protein
MRSRVGVQWNCGALMGSRERAFDGPHEGESEGGVVARPLRPFRCVTGL